MHTNTRDAVFTEAKAAVQRALDNVAVPEDEQAHEAVGWFLDRFEDVLSTVTTDDWSPETRSRTQPEDETTKPTKDTNAERAFAAFAADADAASAAADKEAEPVVVTEEGPAHTDKGLWTTHAVLGTFPDETTARAWLAANPQNNDENARLLWVGGQAERA